MAQSGQHEGFYCKVCDCTVKDSNNYLEHINGKKHNKALGISLTKFTDSTLDEVKAMYEKKKRDKADKAIRHIDEKELPNMYVDQEEEEEEEEEETKEVVKDQEDDVESTNSEDADSDCSEEESDDDGGEPHDGTNR